MIDLTDKIVAQLNTVLPTQYELFLDNTQSIPCISYQLIQDSETNTGNSVGHSCVQYKIKIWARTMQEIINYSIAVDNTLGPMKLHRTSTNELVYGDIICRIMDYEAWYNEKYDYLR